MHRGRTPSLPSPLTARAAACVVALAALGCGDSEASGGHGSGGAGGGHGTAGVTRIAFGSCMHQDAPKPALDRAVAAAPDLFVFLGDNMYGDSDDVDVLAAAYAEQALSPELGRLRDAVPVIATWDDHDYGRNDAGKEYPAKAGSKALFLSFGTYRRARRAARETACTTATCWRTRATPCSSCCSTRVGSAIRSTRTTAAA